jgi:hypothetical protein
MASYLELLLFAFSIPAVIILLLGGVYGLGHLLTRPAKRPKDRP